MFNFAYHRNGMTEQVCLNIALSKPYRMVLKSWKSVQAKQIVLLFTRVYLFRACETHAAKRLPRSSRTSLSYKSNTTGQLESCSFCWSLFGSVPEIEPVENKGCKQEVNYTLECGHVWPSWIFNDCIVRGPRV